MDLIVAVSSNWAIGKDNDLLFSLKTDMKYFRQNTLEKTVILGRKTWIPSPAADRCRSARTWC